MATPEEMSTKVRLYNFTTKLFHSLFCIQFIEDDLQLRTLTDYLDQCRILDRDNPARSTVEFGINRKSILTTLQYFDVCSGALVPDVMHDVLEGVLQYEAKLLLQHCVFVKGYFTANTLQHLVESFELGFMEAANRPTPITGKILRKADNSLRQNG